jgi:hypothetical protein
MRDSAGRFQARRVVVKARVVKLSDGVGRGPEDAGNAAHLCYLERDGVTRNGEKGRVYSTVENAPDGQLERLAQLMQTLVGFEWPAWFGVPPSVANYGCLDDPGFHANPTAISFSQNRYTEGRQISSSRKCTTVEGDMR